MQRPFQEARKARGARETSRAAAPPRWGGG